MRRPETLQRLLELANTLAREFSRLQPDDLAAFRSIGRGDCLTVGPAKWSQRRAG